MGGESTRGRTAARVVGGVAIGAGALAAAVLASTAALSVVVARTVVTPPSRRTDDVAVIDVDAEAGTIRLASTPDSRLPGRYSFWFDGDTGHARLGEIVAQDPEYVTRRIEGVDHGDLAGARRGRLSGWFHLSPEPLGLPWREVAVPTALGDAPAWLVPASEAGSRRWAILVHGRAVTRAETLRAIPALHAAGFHSLAVSYRNDGDAPRSADFRYALGDREWEDVDAAMRYAVDAGADEIVLMGWSMGGATVLQALTRSRLAALVTGVILESPVVDWITTLDFQSSLRRLPKPVRWGAVQLFSHRWATPLTGLAEPLDLGRLDFVARARELAVPILLLHSDDDGFVPATASRALALARADIVRFEEFRVARHTKLWNYDPERWEAAISSWLDDLSPRGS